MGHRGTGSGGRGALGAAAVLAMLGLGPAAPGHWPLTRHTRTRAVSALPVPALPTVGAMQTVDGNDVGDPFVLTVPAGVTPPTDVPNLGDPRDPYQSAPWSPAAAADARAHGWYVLFGTTDWQSNIPTAISTDLHHWTQAPDALPVLPSWAARTVSMTWAPAAAHISGRWILYFSTEEARSHRECLGAAVSSSPAGPYVDSAPAPLLCQRTLGGSIDPSVVTDRAGGGEWLVWKNDGNGHGLPDALWSAPLGTDGLTVAAAPHRLLGADESWDHGIVEAPAMIPAAAGGYWLYYSAGSWDSGHYATGLAYCATVEGPCVDTAPTPFLATDGTLVSPGGLDTAMGLDGRRYVVLTALVPVPSRWHPGTYYWNRVLDVAPLTAG